MPNALPAQLGEFHISGVLGEGAAGVVYAADRVIAGGSPVAGGAPRRLALKVMRAERLAGAPERKQFLHDAALVAAVDHPGIVKLLDWGIFPDERPYLASERLEGETLVTRLATGPLPLEEAFQLFEQLGEALAALHARGLYHGDLRPENVFLTYGVPYGAGERRAQAVLFDFGLARGQAAEPVTVDAEVLALAVALYHLLCARPPWEDGAARHRAVAPSALGIRLPAALETELLRALDARGARRPHSVRELTVRMAAAAGVGEFAGTRPTVDVLATVREGQVRAHVEPAARAPRTKRRAAWWLAGLVIVAGASAVVSRIVWSDARGAAASASWKPRVDAFAQMTHSAIAGLNDHVNATRTLVMRSRRDLMWKSTPR